MLCLFYFWGIERMRCAVLKLRPHSAYLLIGLVLHRGDFVVFLDHLSLRGFGCKADHHIDDDGNDEGG